VVEENDILMSTRRPDRGAVACVGTKHVGSFCSAFLARIQTDADGLLPRYLQEYLRTQTGRLFIAQRCTETTYPVISEDDIETIPVPIAEPAIQEEISSSSSRAEHLGKAAIRLVREAKNDVEGLIDGTLDTKAILSGRIKPPTESETLDFDGGDA
jgi:type I restriction enzyme S subunit